MSEHDEEKQEPVQQQAPRNIIEALLAVKRKLDAFGVSKDRKTETGAIYSYRSVDDVINVVGPMLTEAGIITTIRYEDVVHEDVSLIQANGKTRHGHRVTLRCIIEFHYMSPALGRVMEDGSIVNAFPAEVSTLRTDGLGEALDSGDKATNKAMSIAYKYALGLALPIPFVGKDDPDAEQHQLGKKGEEITGEVMNGSMLAKAIATIANGTDEEATAAYKKAAAIAKSLGDQEAQGLLHQAGLERKKRKEAANA